MVRPMLGDLELEQVQLVEDDEGQVVTRHPVPGLEGDFLQDLGRRAARLRLTGVLTSAGTVEHLGALREKFHAGEPVGFVSDITSATLIDQVLIERMEVTELAGRPSAFEYRFDLREFLEAKPPPTEDVIIPPPPPPDVENGKLAVTVVAEGDPAFDMDRVRVSVRGTEQKTGTDLNRVLTNRTSPNVWFEDPFPAGDYTADALVDDTRTPTGQREVLTGSATVHVDDGQVASVTITLRRGAKIGTVFVITFHFDKAFVEPCMRHVLQQVVTYANQHADEKLLIVGHTDLVGPPTYNQALSERRGRATYAMMTFGSDPQKSIAEWNELRRERPAGTINTVKDTWGTREIQHMLQDLGLYQGNVGVSTGEEATLTDAAIKKFQRDHALTDDGIVGDATWPVLIEAYLGHDPVNLPAAQLMANRNNSGCDSGLLRWIGCSEQDPVLNTEDAWRPNRRTELMFVHEPAMPCPVPKPVTLDQIADGAGGGGWCLDDGTATAVDCFVVPWGKPCPTGAPDPHRPWCRHPAEPGSFTVRGAIHFDDGTPFTGTYVLIAADGEFMNNEVPVTPSSGTPRAGTPNPGRPQADGTFSYAKQKGLGTFSIAVDGPFLIRTRDQSLADVKGNAVCFRLDGSKDADLVIVDRAVASVQPSITGPDAVVVRKPHTNPARQAMVLRASTAFTGTGTFTVSSAAITFFDAAAAGNQVLSGTVFGAAQLAAGATIFAEGATASAALGDVVLTLQLTVGGTLGLSATRAMTAVELTLDVGLSRPAAGGDPPILAEAAKNAPGRRVQMADPLFAHERALLIVRPPVPADFTGALSLAAMGGRLALWNDEVAAAGQVPIPLPRPITGPIPAAGLRFFVDGTAISPLPADTGIQLGLDGAEPDGDHVRATVVQVELTATATAAAPPVTAARIGIWDQAYDPAGNVRNAEAEAANFIGSDVRRLHFRVRDAAQLTGQGTLNWRTLKRDRSDDDAPPSQLLSLPETAAGSRVFISRGMMLAADREDLDQPTHSGLAAPHPDAGLRNRGQSNHRLRQAAIDGSVRGEYLPQPGVRLPVELPVFARNPDERRRLPVRVIRYTNPGAPTYVAASDAYIAGEFARANERWLQVGLLIEPAATVDRVVPAGALNPVSGLYTGAANNPQEQAVLADLLPITPDATLTVVFIHRAVGDNANATVANRNPVPVPPGPPRTLGQRYLIFAGTTNPLNDDTVAHELHHVLFNRFDDTVGREFFTFNSPPPTTDPRDAGIALPDPRCDHRIQNLNAPDPDQDPGNNNILNWVRRARAARQPARVGTGAADATTGNNLVQPF
jgi:outer membrane protein OmpA-like peptidoglycan-associated protein